MINNNIIRYMINDSIKNLLAIPYIRYVNRALSLDINQYQQIQDKLFKDMYSHAVLHVPYYRKNRDKYPQISNHYSCYEFLKMLPVLNKEIIRENSELFVSSKKKKWCTSHTTSGTTGMPLTIYATLFERALSYAILNNWYKNIVRCSSGLPIIALSGFMTPGKKEDLFWAAYGGKHLFLNIYSLNLKNADRIVSLLKKYQTGLLFGYASSLAELARIIEGRLKAFKSNFIAVSTSEILTPYYRAIIEKNLCRKVYDQYASQEGCHLAIECDEGHFHSHPYVGIIEILNKHDEPCQHGEEGRVIVTGFKHAMPLIRYEIGDTAIAFNQFCNCGLSWPMIGAIVGRSEDLVATPDGRRVGYLNFHATKNLKGIAESQLIQKGYKKFIFNIVLTAESVEQKKLIFFNETSIVDQLRMRLGYDIDVIFNYMEHIPREGIRNKFKSVKVDFKF